MNSGFFFGISLTASFLAGVLALFAPCCITFLFPAYLGTIFKESKRVIFYTLIFALGLAAILIPIALGFRFFISFFDAYHSLIYYLGALLMLFMGVMTIKPIFHLPQISLGRPNLEKNLTVFSVFNLGVVSGITSACCAPVLIAAVTLTSLSPTLIQAFLVSAAYILGIVFPLLVLSFFYEKITNIFSQNKREKVYTVFRYLGATVFIFSGLTIAILNFLGKIKMYQTERYNQTLSSTILATAKYFKNPIIDLAAILIIILISYKLLAAKRR